MSLKSEQLQKLSIPAAAPDTHHSAERRANKRWAVVAPLLATSLSMAAYAYFHAETTPAVTPAQPLTSPAATPESHAAAASATTAAVPVDPRIKASGYVVAQRITTVSSSVAGVVRRVFVREGEQVKAGQLLAELENTAALVRVERAKKDLQAASYRLEQAQLKQQRLQTELARFRQLAADRLISSSQLADAELETELAQRQVSAEQNQLALSRDQLKIASIELDYTQVKAPFDGVVTELTAQVGETVSPLTGGGGFIRTGICTIVDLASLQVEVDVSEKHLQALAPGQAVTIGLDAYQGTDYHGQVSYVVPVIDKLKGAVRVKVAVQDFDEKALPGMGVQVYLQPQAVVATNKGAW